MPSLYAQLELDLGRAEHAIVRLLTAHIGAIYGVEEANGVGALVLELIDGPTLADRLRDGPLPIGARFPSLARLPRDETPSGIRRLLRLEKDPKRRLRDIGDARIELDRSTQASSMLTQQSKIR